MNKFKRVKKFSVPKLDIVQDIQEHDIAPPNLDSVARILKDDREVTICANELDTVRELGRGAYGVVDLMKHEPTGILMAIKRIRYTFDETEKRRALMDLNVSMRARCLYTVRFYGALFYDGEIWICMEKMDTSLDKFYRGAFRAKSGIPEPILAKIAYSIVTALDYLKRNLAIMHRDVKPSNILVNREGLVKLCDFGISGQMVDSVARSNLGCKPYMSPERIQAELGATYDVRSDVWSLGITMLEVATGEFPYAWTTNHFEQLKLIVDNPPPRLPKGSFSIHFHEFIERCLQKDRKHRAKYPVLLETAFISQGSRTDISAFVQEVIEHMCATQQR